MNFETFATLHGLLLDKAGRPNGQGIQRCGTEDHPGSKNGAFWYDADERRGWVQRWDQGGEIIWWDDPDRQEPTAAEKAEWASRRAERKDEQLRLWGVASGKSAAMMKSCKLAEHDYLHRKGLGEMKGLVLPTGELFVPMNNFATEAIVGCQTIAWDHVQRKWIKKYLYGSQPRNAVYRIGKKRPDEVILCEGFATGLSINAALTALRLDATVLVCFNDSNVVNIARAMAGTEGIRKYVFADHDASEAGESAAQASGLAYCMSDVEGEDANDLHKRAGVTAVMTKIMEARRDALRGVVVSVVNTNE